MPRRRILQPIVRRDNVRRDNNGALARRVAVNAAAVVGRIGGQMLRNGADAVVRRVVRKANFAPPDKKRKATSAPATERATGAYNQWDTRKYRSGRRIPARVKNQRILKSGIQTIRYQFKGLSGDPTTGAFSGDSGFYWLSNLRSSDGYTHIFPVYVLNLTSVVNDGVTPAPFYRLVGKTSAIGTPLMFSWSQRSGQNSNGGSTGSLLTIEGPGTSATTTQPGAKSFLDWVRIRANIYGATSRPARVRLAIVRFADDEMLPERNVESVQASNKHSLYWSGITKRLISNPIATGNNPAHGAMRTVWSTVVDVDPTSTTESDPDPHMRTVDIFRRIGAVLNYRGDTGAAATIGQLIDPAQGVQHSNSDTFGNYPAKARDNLYLLITGVNFAPQSGTVTDNATTNNTNSSFDLNVHMCHRVLDAF